MPLEKNQELVKQQLMQFMVYITQELPTTFAHYQQVSNWFREHNMDLVRPPRTDQGWGTWAYYGVQARTSGKATISTMVYDGLFRLPQLSEIQMQLNSISQTLSPLVESLNRVDNIEELNEVLKSIFNNPKLQVLLPLFVSMLPTSGAIINAAYKNELVPRYEYDVVQGQITKIFQASPAEVPKFSDITSALTTAPNKLGELFENILREVRLDPYLDVMSLKKLTNIASDLSQQMQLVTEQISKQKPETLIPVLGSMYEQVKLDKSKISDVTEIDKVKTIGASVVTMPVMAPSGAPMPPAIEELSGPPIMPSSSPPPPPPPPPPGKLMPKDPLATIRERKKAAAGKLAGVIPAKVTVMGDLAQQAMMQGKLLKKTPTPPPKPKEETKSVLPFVALRKTDKPLVVSPPAQTATAPIKPVPSPKAKAPGDAPSTT